MTAMAHASRRTPVTVAATLCALLAGVLVAAVLLNFSGVVHLLPGSTAATTAPGAGPAGGGVILNGMAAPNFTLTDQFGRARTLASLRGREVVLTFIDSRCTTVCPLTAEILRTARASLGTAAAAHVTLVAVNANPIARGIATTRRWSILHGMLHRWTFLTGSRRALESVYHAYRIVDTVDANGNIVHDAAIIVIDARGRERLDYDVMGAHGAATTSRERDYLTAGMRQWLPST
jgi:cytochrome oxidase Cu insertion factor (SCO1/SenC/PrrC family)